MTGSLLWLVLSLANREPAAAHIVAPRCVDVAQTLFVSDATRDEREEAVAIAHHESRCDERALGDNGHAFGLFQLHAHWFAGYSGADLLDSPALQVRLVLRAIRTLKAACGPKRLRWMGGYACGVCGGCPTKARELCGPIGCEGG